MGVEQKVSMNKIKRVECLQDYCELTVGIEKGSKMKETENRMKNKLSPKFNPFFHFVLISVVLSSPLHIPLASAGNTPAASAPATPSQGSTLAAPCYPSEEGKGTSKGSPTSGLHAGERSCSVVIPEIMNDLKQQLDQAVDYRYKKCSYVPKSPVVQGCPGTPEVTRVCNLPPTPGIPNTFERPEGTCTASTPGWPHMRTSAGGSLSAPQCIITPYYVEQPIEDSYNAGAWVRSLDCSFGQMQNEVPKLNGVRLTKAICTEFAKKYVEIETHMIRNANIKELANECCPDTSGTPSAVAKSAGGACSQEKIQSACHLKTVRSALEAMFKEIVYCETTSRSNANWTRFIGGENNSNELAALARREIDQQRGKGSQCTDDNEYILFRYKEGFLEQASNRAAEFFTADQCR